ncbi:Sulfite [NADPH] flavoprotein component [Cyphellophora attinorum]|uniref:assimilatory sulfite reductase (NADPH) n=1 Tax=Cyphellophora attinorum TaxID=1664694 RepID=A0A0N0NLM6_9EURO|nr:Sulfite [NADPH] flavoprotein component [Phialophora attinorum]KPI39481.1 Sulfite [NADPH] flavoprotein component [Phialophora attinorum]
MLLVDSSSGGQAVAHEQTAQTGSDSLPFRKQISLSSIGGPTYVTAQTLVQQVAYVLSDKLFTYSPDTFELDVAAKAWSSAEEKNANGYTTATQAMQIRNGAGSIALGYMFSKDFDLKKRHIPQGILASSSALRFLRPVLDQLSLLYGVSNPFVAHVAAADYDGSRDGTLVSDYVSALTISEDLGLALVASHSAYEAQHMALLATLLAQDQPALHVYDGIRLSRETTRVVDVFDKTGLATAYHAILDSTKGEERTHLSTEGKALRTLRALNEELGTDYKPFEYHGDDSPEAVLVTFGSIESSLAAQAAVDLARSGRRVGVISVRLYRPFAEEQFIKLVPQSTRTIAVLGQVPDSQALQEVGVHSRLYDDVLAALVYTSLSSIPEIRDIKYAPSEVWTPSRMITTLRGLLGERSTTSHASFVDHKVQQYSFWNVDDSPASDAAHTLAQALAKDSSQNVTVSTTHDNLIQGGVHRVDVRKSPRSLEAPYSIVAADTAVVTDAKLLEKVAILDSVKNEGKLIVSMPGVKDEDVEKKLAPWIRRGIAKQGLELYLVDPTRTGLTIDADELESLIFQAAFLRIALGESEEVARQKLAAISANAKTLEEVAADLELTLREIEVPKEWLETEIDCEPPALPLDVTSNSFATFDKTEEEPPTQLRSWQKAAKGLLFKEAYGTQDDLRPDLPTKTYTVHVKENRRLTPITYDRNIFHIEFDLGTSGLKYDIGEALGIHAENDHGQVMEFIKWYGLDADDVVEVQARDSATRFENRTIYQSLMQNVDIFGRPPKKFYEALADFADDENEKKTLLTLAGPEGFKEFQRRAEVDTVTYADILLEFPSAHPSFHDIVRIVAPMKRREYSIASCQAVTPTSVALMVVVVNWVDPRERDRFGQATKYLVDLKVGAPVTVSVKPSVMKLPPNSTQPLIMAGLGTGLAPFRAFVQHRAMEKAQGKEIGSVLLYMGSRHQREEYCYGEEWEAYQAAGVITLLGRAFSRDQPQKIYIQDRMRQTIDQITEAYIKQDGAFYLCGPTWPVPDVTNVLEEAIAKEKQKRGEKVKRGDASRRIMELKDEGRYVLEVY